MIRIRKICSMCLVILILLLISWQDKESRLEYLKHLEIIDITSALDKGEQVMASKIFSDLRYIELETTEESMFRTIQDIVVYNGNIFIESAGRVLRFDESGRFLNTIGSIGRGPGEFSATNISLNILRDEAQIAIADHGMRKVHIYEFSGRHVISINIDIYPYHTASISNHLLSFTGWTHAQFSNNYAISVTTLKGRPSGNLLPAFKYIPKTGRAIVWKHITDGFYYLGDSLSLRVANMDTIYRIPDKNIIFPRYYLSAGKKHLTWEKRYNTGDPDRSIRKGSIYFNGFIETPEYVFLGARVMDVPGQFLYYKSGKIVQNIGPLTGSGNVPSIRGFTNDIDGGLPFWPVGHFSDKELFAFFEPRFLRGHLRNISLVPQKHNFNSEKHLKLKERTGNSDLNSNPWIMIAKMK